MDSIHSHPLLYPVTGKGRLRHLVRVQGGVCWWCLRPFGWSRSWHSRPTIEHVQPRSKGGENEPHNLTAACYQCNQQKADKIVPEHWSAEFVAEVFIDQRFREEIGE